MNDLKQFTPLIYIAVLGALAFFIIKFIKNPIGSVVDAISTDKTAGKEVETVIKETVKQTSPDKMASGLTYAEVAQAIKNIIYTDSFNGFKWFFSESEKNELARIVLKIKHDEYDRLSTVYLNFKNANHPAVILRPGGTLTQDLKDVFSKEEQANYFKNLNLV